MSTAFIPHPSFYTIAAVDPPGPWVGFMLGEAPPIVTQPGGWSIVERPRRVGMTEWVGYEPHTMDVSFILEGYAYDLSVETEIEKLRQLARRPVGPQLEPAKVTCIGPAIPLGGKIWVISDVVYDADIEIRLKNGLRCRAGGTISLLEYAPPTLFVTGAQVVSPAAAAAERNSSTGSARTYTVVAGDTLSGIAARQLGNASRWPEIASLNGIRDPNSITVGQVLRLPS